ncbi:MAG: hypothetical protein Q4B60_05025 [Erysipelotrichaceae bacterium]|nr:hypothetical protein [Erysipelotrichaceae bacterium]
MKKLINILLVLLLCIGLSACGKEKTDNKIPGGGEVIVQDPPEQENAITLSNYLLYTEEGFPVISTYLPEDWYAGTIMQYVISDTYPMQVLASMCNADRSFGIYYLSPTTFKDIANLYTGERTPDDGSHTILNYRTHLHYRDAYDTCDLIFNMLGFKWVNRESLAVDQDVLNTYKTGVLDMAKNNFNSEKNMLDQSGTKYQSIQLISTDATIDRSQGYLTDGSNTVYGEALTFVRMQDIRFEADTLIMLNQVYGSETISWQYDGFALYWAVDEKTFRENYDMAQFIISNTGTCESFKKANDEFLGVVIPMVLNGQMEVAEYGQQKVREVMSAWNQTNDRVAQNWDDYIQDRDRYVTSDGVEITVPTTADYVYYDSDSGDVIWTDSASYDAGPSFELLNKKY